MINVNADKAGYKHTPFGWIPENWEIKELSTIGEIQQGVSKGKQVESSKMVEIPYMRVANIKDGFMDLSEIKKLVVDKNDYQRYLLKKEDILITEGGDPDKLGRGAIWNEEVKECIYQNHLFRIRCLNELIPAYFFTYLQSNRAKTYFLNSAKQTTGIASINSTQVKEMPVLLPSISEQVKISGVFSAWDKSIQTLQQLIEQLRKRNKSLMQQLLKPKIDWRMYHIKDLLEVVKRPVDWNDEELYHLISVRRRSGGAFYREKLYGKQILTKNLFTAEEGDFLISKMQIVHGASAIVPARFAGMKISGSYIAAHARDKKILNINFFNWLSKTPWFYRLTYISSYGVHIEKMTFDFEDFKRRKISLPSTLGEQKRIVEILETASNEIQLYQEKCDSIQLQKKGLMQKLLTGQVRVNI